MNKSRFAYSLAALIAVSAMTAAQITMIPQASLVAPVVLDFDAAGPGPGVISGNHPYFTAAGLCNVAIINAPGMNTPGDALSSGGTLNCLASVNNQLAIVARNGAMDNHAAGTGWAFRLAPGTIATQFGAEIVDQVNHTMEVQTYVGGILQNSFSFIPGTAFPNPYTAFEDLAGFDEIRFMNIVSNGGWGIDDFAIGNVLGSAGPCPPAPATPFQTNTTSASLDINGVMSPGFAAAITTTSLGLNATVTLDSNIAAAPFDLVVSPSVLLPSVLVTPGQQVVNVTLGGSVWLNGGFGPLLLPFPGTLAIPVSSPTPLTASAQAVFVNPASVDGFSLTQGSQLEVRPCTSSSGFENLAIGIGTYPYLWTGGATVVPGASDWTVGTGSTSSTATGPSAAAGGSLNYLYCETSVAAGTTFVFETCDVDVSTSAIPTLGLEFNANGATIGTLTVEEITPGGGIPVGPPVVIHPGGNLTDVWNIYSNFYNPAPTLRLRFTYVSGTSFTGDLAIDNITIF